MKAKEYPIGSKYGMLTLTKEVERHISPSGQTKRRFEFVCDCGNVCTQLMNNVNRGVVISCGCFGRERHIKHSAYKTPTYKIWLGIKARCYNENLECYKDYGARGIKVCERWLESFENFFEEMGERPEGLSIDRIDVNGDYSPGNCRWADSSTQVYNRRPANETLYTGVTKRGKNSWRVSIGKNNRVYSVGTYKSLMLAVWNRQRVEIELYGVVKTFWKG